MERMVKVKCIYCGGIFYLLIRDMNLLLPVDVELGEAFPQTCVLCNECHYVVFLRHI